MRSIRVKDDSLLKALFQLDSLKNEIVCCRQKAGRLTRLIRKVASFSKDRLMSCTLDINLLKSGIMNSLNSGQNTLSATDCDNMIRACDHLRLQILSTLLEAYPSPLSDGRNKDWNREPVVREKSGMAWTRIADSKVILLPDMNSPGSCDLVACEMLRLLDSSSDFHWIIDCSALRSTPSVIFMGALGGYMEKLASRGKGFVLLWLRDSLFSEVFRGQLTAAFKLTRLGGYLFSDNVMTMDQQA